jgi:hypothetical protein
VPVGAREKGHKVGGRSRLEEGRSMMVPAS